MVTCCRTCPPHQNSYVPRVGRECYLEFSMCTCTVYCVLTEISRFLTEFHMFCSFDCCSLSPFFSRSSCVWSRKLALSASQNPGELEGGRGGNERRKVSPTELHKKKAPLLLLCCLLERKGKVDNTRIVKFKKSSFFFRLESRGLISTFPPLVQIFPARFFFPSFATKA